LAISFQKEYQEGYPGPWVQQEKYSWPEEKIKLGNPDLKIDRERNAVNLVI
jgi:hypothetical protein